MNSTSKGVKGTTSYLTKALTSFIRKKEEKRKRRHNPSKRVVAIEEIFEKLDQLHQTEGKHFGRTKLYKYVTQQYYGITEKICGLFVSTCKTCHLKNPEIHSRL